MASKARAIIFGRLAIVAFIFTLLALVLRGPLDSWINNVALGQLDYTNQQYLEESFDDASRLFLILTGVKSVLAVVEGSEVGVGFGLEIGDIVQGVYDYVDFAWKIVLWATMIIVMTRMLLEVSQFLDQWLLALALGSMLFYLVAVWFMPRRRAMARVLRDATFFCTILSVAAYVIVPLAVSGGAFLSTEITQSRVIEAEGNLTVLNAELNERFSDIEKAEGIFSKAAKVKDATSALTSFLAERTSALFWDVITVSAAYLFDTVIFPLGLFFVLFWMTRLIGRYAFGLRRGQVFREDMDTLMGRYWTQRPTPIDARKKPEPDVD
ncbi:hypothetical protein [Cerasicoccus arenae]|uniref:Uncharacterized protein n=1 Tax=Cerasicoccus arenae TaxID=424488 RepID=A0A8J3DJF4_9BACT|nr:hypothetical protein [Cerasicoccus arenae]MBK1858516.1 hypothetical protein [Cerasicoccus arenae]GHC10147.1 hypothetical protein GCM10007047_29310 [Cerasicoccus arenae]